MCVCIRVCVCVWGGGGGGVGGSLHQDSCYSDKIQYSEDSVTRHFSNFLGGPGNEARCRLLIRSFIHDIKNT